MGEPFPQEVVRFVDAHIESVDQLEILRVLGEAPDREWGAGELGTAAQAPPRDIAYHLAALQARGLLAVAVRGAEPFYRWAPSSPELDRLAKLLLEHYRQRPVTMIRLVYDRAADPLRVFSDAFRLRREEG